ncbi:glycosyltransferase [Guptibacillus algicola]|uniref:glycosyltransferase n=1 Tax=Guptibacillus algicola TaxID=225844 RepID=UPI001CD6091C|nr:glycosyltransferase [Alkalihalobacillus algicola]MCA0987859.1 glycosyltransferase [Alkalihalobacillus algicola]
MLVELANGLANKGHQVTFVMPPGGVIEYPNKVQVIRTPQAQIKAEDFPVSDIIVSNFYTLTNVCHQASLAGKGAHVRISLCYEPVFLDDHEASFKSYHISKNLIVLSNWQKQLIKLNHGIEGNIVPVGVSEVFKNMNIRKDNKQVEVSCMLRIPEGGYSWHREQEYLISVLTKLKQTYPTINVNLITPPSELRSSKWLRQVHGNPLFQSLTPQTDQQLNLFLNRSDIFVSSSTYDTASLPGLEAMKCGAALATVYSGGNMDYCRSGENCLLSYRHENKLYQDVTTLIQQPKFRNNLMLQGEKEAAKWTWARSVNHFEKALTSFIK